jgi:hypothetical protein
LIGQEQKVLSITKHDSGDVKAAEDKSLLEEQPAESCPSRTYSEVILLASISYE